MTYEEAIRRIETHNKIHFAKEFPRAIKITEALDMAIEALEKQIPKKPVWECLGDSLSNADIITMCPCCYKSIEEGEHHCECGQAIDWSE